MLTTNFNLAPRLRRVELLPLCLHGLDRDSFNFSLRPLWRSVNYIVLGDYGYQVEVSVNTPVQNVEPIAFQTLVTPFSIAEWSRSTYRMTFQSSERRHCWWHCLVLSVRIIDDVLKGIPFVLVCHRITHSLALELYEHSMAFFFFWDLTDCWRDHI